MEEIVEGAEWAPPFYPGLSKMLCVLRDDGELFSIVGDEVRVVDRGVVAG
jgi:hypothetical protein